ncbi:MAG: carboxypeptidase-like regulatory domain-containing protein, partial [Armatimonadota bacterium]|nr:carboxypeptidase-like regulatory domain-containing protein [Armatimonadota bacterium]
MRKWILGLFGLAISMPLGAQTPQGTLSVRVYDLTTGNNLNNATVRVVSNDNSIDRTASTGSGNTVSFSNLPVNLTYTVTVSRADYRTRTVGGIILRRDDTNYYDVFLTSTLQTVGS